ncbi:LOW QUALITY PROTEIN: hypothetical protein MSG28_002714 [Choristoneura fumiferana]|uniref:Uncharacterized protein n=2 Tax=Choristoneura fumiferana TaxID=7141 RepID=A0ACC0JJ12_CHOFU|nr:LOW QUALITY PROTEIN: hypothetical protein MSG28_002714 [Choristoneura fumiferana]KAI8424108.1 LOW QUALITY PROTEIN: hypothetical protein MSG28_002714 [Choristoneura fumiferana]
MMTGDLMLNLSRVEHPHHNNHAPMHRTHYHRYNSTPASPNEGRLGARGETAQRHNSSPDTGLVGEHASKLFSSQPASPAGGAAAATASEMGARAPLSVRTSRSEDHLQESSLSAVAVEMEEDVTSSLNTLLDARPDSATPGPRSESDAERDRIVWTYNAPVSCASERSHCNGSGATSNSTSISDGISQRSSSPASPTSVSSSVMSSRATPPHRAPLPSAAHHHRHLNGDMSLSEAVSNISSPDYQDQDDMFETGRECPRMELSDPSDSDSTILVSEPCHKRAKSNSSYSNDHGSDVTLNGDNNDYRIVIQVKGADKQNANAESVNNNNSYAQNGKENGHSLPESHGYQGSDGDSLHSFHYSPKAVDIPSAERLAKRLYHLDGFKNNEFSRAVAEEYVKHFSFAGATLDAALREFLARFALSGETQERERVLVHFSRRYLECNPGSFNSQVTVRRRRRRAAAASRSAWARTPSWTCPTRRAPSTPFGRRGWKMFYCTLRDLVLFLHKDEHGFRRGQMSDNLHNAIRIHHALATKATDYTKKQHVFRLQTADQAEYLFQTSDSKELCSWVETINFVCAAYSAPPLAGAVGSQRKFQRPLLPCAHTRLSMTINFVCAAYSAPPLAGAVGSQRKFQRPLLPCAHTRLSMEELAALRHARDAPHAPHARDKDHYLVYRHIVLTREQQAAHEERAARLEEELAALRHARDAPHAPHARDKDHYLVYEVPPYCIDARAAGGTRSARRGWRRNWRRSDTRATRRTRRTRGTRTTTSCMRYRHIVLTREQLAAHEERAARLEEELAALRHARDAPHAPHARTRTTTSCMSWRHEERAARLEEELAALRHARDAPHAPHARDKDHYLVRRAERAARLEEELAALRHARDAPHAPHARDKDHYLVYEVPPYCIDARAAGGARSARRGWRRNWRRSDTRATRRTRRTRGTRTTTSCMRYRHIVLTREQLAAREERAARLEEELAALRHARDAPHAPHARDKDHYLVYEIKRYRTYAYVMRARAGGAGAEEAAPALPLRAPPAPAPAPAPPAAPP